MAHSLSARKRVRQNARRRALNRWRLRALRTALKDFRAAVAGGDVTAARDVLRSASAVVDRSAQKGIIHRNQAARRKSRMSAAVRKMAEAA